jgi:surface antigen
MRAVLALAAAALLSSPPVLAVNWNRLKYSPVADFTDRDFELLRKAGREALDASSDGDTREWRNPETGAHGTVKPLSTYEAEGATCRRVEIFNAGSGSSGTSRFDFCRQPDGTWKVAPQRQAPGP